MRWLALTLVLLAGACGGGGKEDDVARPAVTIYHFERDLQRPSSFGEIACVPAAGGCPNAAPGELAQYLVLSGARLDGDDVDRERTRADHDAATGQPVVLLSLTESGAEKLRELSRSIAKSGRASGSPHPSRSSSRASSSGGRSSTTGRSPTASWTRRASSSRSPTTPRRGGSSELFAASLLVAAARAATR